MLKNGGRQIPKRGVRLGKNVKEHVMKKGFTLIELLIVIAIIAILALIAIPNFLEAQTRANVSRAAADMRTIATAIEAYTVDNRVPPLTFVAQGAAMYGLKYSSFAWNLYTEYDYKGYKPDCAFDLTTPIAYMTGRAPMDPFFDKANETDLAQPRRGSYVFFNPQVMYYADQNPLWGDALSKNLVPSPFLDVKFNSKDSSAYHISWALASAGPDRSIRDPRTTDGQLCNTVWFLFQKGGPGTTGGLNDWLNGGTALYDPTNGTASTGNIWRLSSGAMK
jgi:prepilin-type N-terminal cleavage/methylation domain-containing protein